MPAWLKTHAVFVSCVTAAIISENGDPVQLSNKKKSVRLMVNSSVLYWQSALRGKVGTLAMAPHANAAKEEMGLLAGKVITMVHSSPVPTPTLDKLLYSFIQTIHDSPPKFY
jgi:hypothetical protein